MSAVLAMTIMMPPPDLMSREFGIKGLFRADYVVGNHKARKFVLVYASEEGRLAEKRGELDDLSIWTSI